MHLLWRGSITPGLSVLIPVKEPAPHLPDVLIRVKEIRSLNPGLILEVLLEREGSLSEARGSLAKKARGSYILNLDADLLIPLEYVPFALKVLKNYSCVGSVIINYSGLNPGHAGFGGSVMKRQTFLEVYHPDQLRGRNPCECEFFFGELYRRGLLVAAAPMAAKHLK